ncbi:probable long-chain-alcohol O-fatty-acyltransferase 5 [Mercurialis annua]|uniref:probable long-chain-alcohol O-fatty-acyltransferase 5 n=1 Tax=Mercurialis annua TaxID=3986 RepID=UPI00215E2BDE|nr:probable long-chain-alcohol O-fatty-acyltransferase 5 [Mercurialis annua]
MEGDAKSLIKIWSLAIISLCYCYYIVSKIPKGVFRLFSLLPVFYLFVIIPLEFVSLHLIALSTFFFTWLGTFKLLLFSFDQGPLSPLPSQFSTFICLACFPIKPGQNSNIARGSQLYENTKSNQKSNKRACRHKSLTVACVPKPLNVAIKATLLLICFISYNFKHLMHHHVILFIYCVHLYLELEIVLAVSVIPVRALTRFELEPQFDEPYLSTSLQEFWGHRWNLMATNILRPFVYHPIRNLFKGLIGLTLASLIAVLAAFGVSGLMHEVLFFYLTRVNPTGEAMCFFILHGACVAVEVAIKKMVKDKWRLHPNISAGLTFGFVIVTAIWLFYPPIGRSNVAENSIKEFSIWLDILIDKLSN